MNIHLPPVLWQRCQCFDPQSYPTFPDKASFPFSRSRQSALRTIGWNPLRRKKIGFGWDLSRLGQDAKLSKSKGLIWFDISYWWWAPNLWGGQQAVYASTTSRVLPAQSGLTLWRYFVGLCKRGIRKIHRAHGLVPIAARINGDWGIPDSTAWMNNTNPCCISIKVTQNVVLHILRI